MERGIQFAAQDRVGTAAAEAIFGASGTAVMAVAILISTFGCNNGLILSGARVYYAMARDGLFFARAGKLSDRRVPAFALGVQAVWVSLLCLTGTYGQLLDYVIFAALVFYVLRPRAVHFCAPNRRDLPRSSVAVAIRVLPALYFALRSPWRHTARRRKDAGASRVRSGSRAARHSGVSVLAALVRQLYARLTIAA